MKTRKFLILLGLVVLALVLSLALFHFIFPIDNFLDITIWSLGLFALFTLAMFFLGRRAARSKNGNLFLYIIIMNVFVKLIGSFVIVFVYVEYKSPESNMFIVPFLMNYLYFTIFETYFLSKQAHESAS